LKEDIVVDTLELVILLYPDYIALVRTWIFKIRYVVQIYEQIWILLIKNKEICDRKTKIIGFVIYSS